MHKITIVGSGNGGSAKAAHLSALGHDVTVYDLPEFGASIEEIHKAGGINVRAVASTGLPEGFFSVRRATTDIEEALDGAEVVMVTVPSFAHPRMAEVCAPFLKSGQIVFISPGNLYAGIQFMQALRKAGNTNDVKLAEADCMIYAVRKEKTEKGPGVWIRGYKRNLGVGAFPARDTDAVFAVLADIYPSLIKRNNILETGLCNVNPFVHVPIGLLNFGDIERKTEMQLYYEALTPSIGNVIEKMDAERMAFVSQKILNLPSLTELVMSWYGYQGMKGSNIFEMLQSNPAYHRSMLPSTKEHRFFYEDVTYGLYPIIDLLDRFDLPGETMRSLAHICSLVMGKDLAVGARTLASLGFGSVTGKELLQLVHDGM